MPATMPHTYARSVQVVSDARDDALTSMVKAEEGRRRHWWTRRTVNGVHGAWCYFCLRHITTWDYRHKITERARAAIDNHRTMHIFRDLVQPGHSCEGSK